MCYFSSCMCYNVRLLHCSMKREHGQAGALFLFVGTMGGCDAGRGPRACPVRLLDSPGGQARGPHIHSHPPLVPTDYGGYSSEKANCRCSRDVLPPEHTNPTFLPFN